MSTKSGSSSGVRDSDWRAAVGRRRRAPMAGRVGPLLLLCALLASACTVRQRRALPQRAPQAAAEELPLPERLDTTASSPSRAFDVLDYVRSRELMVPVEGVEPGRIPDSFSAARGDRTHNAHDIMAPRGTPVLSADDGYIIRLASNTLGGITIYASDPGEVLVYYYAHLDRYAAGVRAGERIRKGQLLGYVGSTGNASASAPHLHFQVARMLDVSRHWEGEPIDVREYFALPGKRYNRP